MLETLGLKKAFGPIQAVRGISFEVKKGEILGFLGPNGAGKSTTMRMLTGFLVPDAGKVTIGDHAMETAPIAAKSLIGYLPENAPGYGDMTAESFLKFVATMCRLSGQQRRDAVERVIETCHLEPVRHQTIETMSKGYTHRTCFAQALVDDPPALVLDEPTDGLDPNQKHEVRELIRRMGEQKAIILSTHILEEVDAVCTRVVIIDQGKVVANGTPAELKAQSPSAGAVEIAIANRSFADVKARLGQVEGAGKVLNLHESDGACRLQVVPRGAKDREGLAPRVARACSEAGWTVFELHTLPGRLDEVFRAITTGEGAEGGSR